MQALALARQRIRARLQSPSTPRPVRLAHGLVEEGNGRMVPILSSTLAQEILSRGYDAWTLDRIYSNRPSSEMGLVGRFADRAVLDLPVHLGLRERLEATVGEICSAAVMTLRAGTSEFRMLSAPCGLAFEMVGVAARLRLQHPELFGRLRCWGVDPDREGTLLPEAARRTRATGLAARFIREDLRRHREVAAVAQGEGPFQLVSCLGVSQEYGLEETAALLQFYSGLLAPGGTLLVDCWEPCQQPKAVAGLHFGMRCQGAREFRRLVGAAGLHVEREHPSGEGGCILMVTRKTAPVSAPYAADAARAVALA